MDVMRQKFADDDARERRGEYLLYIMLIVCGLFVFSVSVFSGIIVIISIFFKTILSHCFDVCITVFYPLISLLPANRGGKSSRPEEPPHDFD
jgi:uncharacterized membrane protein YhaH (DUF805 family)